ncbi:hypothetical protein L9F63_003359, partial [Diploptera punctata]
VSWVRRKDEELHLITFGLHTYSSDSRYSLNYQRPNDWRLEIQFANERDQGFYECQVRRILPSSSTSSSTSSVSAGNFLICPKYIKQNDIC